MHAPKSLSYVTLVPAYKAKPSVPETFALAQLKQLSLQNITLACPNHFDFSAYIKPIPDLKVIRLPEKHFESVQSYNELMLQPWFYELFASEYEWMLVHQLDAFLLTNQVDKFCNLGYHYFGAPWRVGFPQYRFLFDRWPIQINRRRFHVGNGGLSLRHLGKTINLLLRKHGHVSKTYFMEDAFFGYWGSIDSDFRACPVNIAASFSLESHPEYWMKINNMLPMGFHGHGVWDPAFYKPLLDLAYSKLNIEHPPSLSENQ